jgi:hypothetical protein
MGKPETYIKMCDCPEIQENCSMFIGDYFVDVSADNFVSINGISEMDTNDTWLPRQDQIQEMLNYSLVRFYEQMYHFIGKFIDGKRGNIEYNGLPSERIILAFYMYEKYGKVWDGKQWVKKERKIHD